MLSFWERHFASLIGHENCFVIDNGGDDGSIDILNPKTNKVRLPLGAIDHWDWCQFNGYFLRFLLTKYVWVVHVDTDEMLVADGDFSEKISNAPAGIYSPEKAIKVVHNSEDEMPFDFSSTLAQQRSHFVEEDPSFKKPCIASTPATWHPGFHQCYEPWKELSGLWLVHMREVDSAMVARREIRFAKRPQTARDAGFYDGVKKWSGKAESEIEEETLRYLRGELAQPRVSLPEWFNI